MTTNGLNHNADDQLSEPPSLKDSSPNHTPNGSMRAGEVPSLRFGRANSHGFTNQPSLKYQVQNNDMKYIRDRLTPQELQACDEQMISIFIRATQGDLDLSVKRLKDTLRWRAAEKPDQICCTACQKKDHSHYLHVVGFDLLERPVMYSCIGMATNKKVEANQKHMVATFEQSVKMMPPHVEAWVWVCDFYGFGMVDCDPRLARSFVHISAQHYPERLGLFLLVGAPRIFSGLWNMVAPMVDPVTKRKFKFVPYDHGARHGKSVTETELNKHFDDETVAWLLAEMAQNRDRKAAKQKVYSYSAYVKGLTAQPEGTHNCLGTSAAIETFSSRPDLLKAFVPPSVLGR